MALVFRIVITKQRPLLLNDAFQHFQKLPAFVFVQHGKRIGIDVARDAGNFVFQPARLGSEENLLAAHRSGALRG